MKASSVSLGALLSLALAVAPVAADDLTARKRAAGLPATPAAQLAALAADSRWEVREAVAQNRRTPAALLSTLAADPDPHVRIAVATNLSTPASVHHQLARDPDPQVRSVVARFEYVPIPVLMILADDPLVDIRLEVARSLNANEQVLRKVMTDSDPTVSHIAGQALQALREDAQTEGASSD